MNFHPDVLAAHAQFGGDLEGMQALYDRPDHVAEIARLQEQVETLTRERDGLIKAVANHVTVRGEYFARIKAAEAERDRLREAGAYYIDRLKAAWAGKPVRDMGEAESAWLAALQKEPKP